METSTSGLIAIGEIVCDGCGKTIRYPQRYAYICESGKSAMRICEECSRLRGHLQWEKDDKGPEVGTFLKGRRSNPIP